MLLRCWPPRRGSGSRPPRARPRALPYPFSPGSPAGHRPIYKGGVQLSAAGAGQLTVGFGHPRCRDQGAAWVSADAGTGQVLGGQGTARGCPPPSTLMAHSRSRSSRAQPELHVVASNHATTMRRTSWAAGRGTPTRSPTWSRAAAISPTTPRWPLPRRPSRSQAGVLNAVGRHLQPTTRGHHAQRLVRPRPVNHPVV